MSLSPGRDPNLTSFYDFRGQDENAIMKKHKEWFDTPSIQEKGVKAM